LKIYILTYRRVNRQLTLKKLPEIFHPVTTVVCHKDEEEALRQVVPAGVSLLPHEVVGGSAVREFILDHHREHEADPRFVMFDDDLAFGPRVDGKLIGLSKVDEDTQLEAWCDFFDEINRALAVYPLAGMLPGVHANRRDPDVKWYLNMRLYAVWGVNAKILDEAGIKFNRVRYADDFDVMMQVNEAGLDFVGYNQMVASEVTLKRPATGGEWTTDQLVGVEKKVDSYKRMQELHPDIVSWWIKKGTDPDEIEPKDVKIRISWKRLGRPNGPLKE